MPAASVTSTQRYVVRHGDFAVEFDDHFDDDLLRRVLRVVAGC